jgi:hypothetical protein
MDIFCMDPREATQANLSSNGISWMPDRPRGLRLSRKSFANNVQIQWEQMTLDFQKGSFGLILDPPAGRLETFCASIGHRGKIHPHIKFHLPYENPENGKLYLYLSATATQTTSHGTQNFGSVFIMRNMNCFKRSASDLIYYGTLSYDICWSDHAPETAHNSAEQFISARHPMKSHRMNVLLGPSLD